MTLSTLMLVAIATAHPAITDDTAKKDVSPALDFTMKNIDGKEVKLADYQGSVLMMVNVASKCGLTRQYEQLEALNKKYKDKGLKILGFPANNFGGQEPGSNEQIKSFCTNKYGVSFDMFAKVSVKGDDQCPLYGYLTDETRNAPNGGDITWNFTKFLIGRDGKVIARFEPRTKPMDDKVTAAIEKALTEKP